MKNELLENNEDPIYLKDMNFYVYIYNIYTRVLPVIFNKTLQSTGQSTVMQHLKGH